MTSNQWYKLGNITTWSITPTMLLFGIIGAATGCTLWFIGCVISLIGLFVLGTISERKGGSGPSILM